MGPLQDGSDALHVDGSWIRATEDQIPRTLKGSEFRVFGFRGLGFLGLESLLRVRCWTGGFIVSCFGLGLEPHTPKPTLQCDTLLRTPARASSKGRGSSPAPPWARFWILGALQP